MEKVINVSDVSINTVTVEAKVIQINKREMTLAVYRQLKREPISKNGIIWGTVNYHSGEICKGLTPSKHFHVIWQKGNELRHAVVNQANSPELFEYIRDEIDQLFIAI